jgi:dolichyl-phosphate-mannose--protein O-mannosyl transferase
MNDTLPVDNAHVTQSRLILLDAALILFMSLSLLFYIKFHQMRYRYVLPLSMHLALN